MNYKHISWPQFYKSMISCSVTRDSNTQHDTFCICNMTAKVQGSFSAGFEPVKEALEKLLNSGCEDKVQLCVYVGKDCVLDLYGSFGSNDSTYNSDTIQVLVRLKGLKLKPN